MAYSYFNFFFTVSGLKDLEKLMTTGVPVSKPTEFLNNFIVEPGTGPPLFQKTYTEFKKRLPELSEGGANGFSQSGGRFPPNVWRQRGETVRK
jgi:hypothetical protein